MNWPLHKFAHDTAGAYENILNDIITKHWITVKQNFHAIWTSVEKALVKYALGSIMLRQEDGDI